MSHRGKLLSALYVQGNRFMLTHMGQRHFLLTTMSGWVSIHRKMMEKRSYFSEPFCRNMAWVDMILLANHEKNWFRCRGVKVEVLRGQIGFGLDELAKRWKWSRGKVERFMKELEDDEQIVRQKSNVTTLITIVNYNQYQKGDKANSKADDKANGKADGNQTVKQTDVNNNGNKVNNENKERVAEILPPVVDISKSNLFRQPNVPSKTQVWECFSSKGGTKEMAKTFYENNESTGWFHRGSPITNFQNLVPSFIANWQKFDRKDKPVDSTNVKIKC